MGISVRESENGQGWQIDVTARPFGAAKTRRVKRTVPKSYGRRKAEKIGCEMHKAIIDGTYRTAKEQEQAEARERIVDMTLEQWADQWIELSRRGGRYKESTLAERTNNLRRHIVPVLGECRVREIRRKHALDVIDTMRARNLAPKTINNMITNLRVCLADWYEHHDLEDTAPALRNLELKNNRKNKPQLSMTTEQIDAVLRVAHATGPLAHVVALLALHGGLRVGEIQGLEWSHFERDAGRHLVAMIIQQGVSKTGKLQTPKHDKIRRVPVTPTLASALEALASAQGFAKVPTGAGFVVHNPKNPGQPSPYSRVANLMGRVQRDAGVLEVSRTRTRTRKDGRVVQELVSPQGQLHRMRRACASQLDRAGVRPRVTQQLLGHDEGSTTNLYIVVENSELDTAVRKLEDNGAKTPGPRAGFGPSAVPENLDIAKRARTAS